MSFWHSTHIKKTRKEHHCEYCHVFLPIGSSCSNEFGLWDGEINNYYLCDRCSQLVHVGEPWLSDEGELGNLFDVLFDIGDSTDCPICGRMTSLEDVDDDKMSCVVYCDDCDCSFNFDLSAENLLSNY